MNFFDFFRKKEEHVPQPVAEPAAPQPEERSIFGVALNYGGAGSPVSPMRLSTVYRCVEAISDSVAQLPMEIFSAKDNKKLVAHPAYFLLNKEPSPRMSRYIFIKTLVTSMLLRGNGYAYIRRDGLGNVRELLLLDATLVTVMDDGLEVHYHVTGIGDVPARDMIHILNHTTDGIHGLSTIAYASGALGLAQASEDHARGFFTGGANVGGILTVDGPLNQKQGDDIKQKWNSSFGPTGTPNGVAVLPGNMRFQSVTVNPTDAQLLETRQYSVVDICRFFGVSPVKCFDLSKSSYSTVEATQLAFLTDTISPILEKIELEMERKLFREDEKWLIDVRFDTSALLRTDVTSRASYINTMFYLGALSVNEVRNELNLPPIDGGDAHFLQVNLQTLEAARKRENTHETSE